MKRIIRTLAISVLFTLSIFTYGIKDVEAATGTLSISSSSSVTVGSNFTVTIKATGSKIFYWQFYVSYDASKLKLVSGSTTIQGEADDATYGTNSVSKTLTFKALSTGSANISVARGDASMNIDTNFNSISYVTSKKSVSINSVVPKSPNNNLSSLSIENVELTPAFSADVTNYSTELPAGTTEISVNAALADPKATIVGNGKVAVIEGNNAINVEVTAEDGSKKTYVINAVVKEYAPINVEANGKKYTVIRKKGLYDAPLNFTESTIKINDEDVLAYVNEKIKCTVVGLKDEKGKIELFVYDNKDNKYKAYNNVTIGGINLYLKELIKTSLIPPSYKRVTVTIDNKAYSVWNYNGSRKFYLMYGIDTANGDESFYLYDKEKQTVQRFYNDQVVDLNKELDETKMILYITLGSVALILFITLIFLIVMLSKKNQLKKKQKIQKSSAEEYLEKTIDIEKELKKSKKKK